MIGMTLAELARAIGLERRSGDAVFEGVCTDSRKLVAGELFVALKGERFDGHDFLPKVIARGAAGAVVSRWQDVNLPQLVCPDTQIALGQIAAYWRYRCNARVIGVTGSNGKTTVKSMLYAILDRVEPCLVNIGNLNNEIGVPLTLCRLGPEHHFAVIEMGASRPGDIRYLANLARPSVGVVTNAGSAHLEGMGSVDQVARVKGELFEALPAAGTLIINADDPHADYWRGLARKRAVITFGLDHAADVSGQYRIIEGLPILDLRGPMGEARVQLPVSGRHNALNALAAVAAAHAAGAGLEAMVMGLEGFKPESGRLQRRPLRGWTLIEDTYNANPASLRAGVEALVEGPGPHWLVLGDMAELGEGSGALHYEAGAQARQLGVSRLFCLGEMTRHTVAGFGQGAEHFDDREALIERFLSELEAGVTCLIKGSRSMRMEEVAARLVKASPGGATCS